MHNDRPNDIWATNKTDADKGVLEEAVAKLQTSIPPKQNDEPDQKSATKVNTGPQNDQSDAHVLVSPHHLLSKAQLFPTLFGFLAGAVFWHLVGFWSLVSDMVFHGPREKSFALSQSNTISSTNTLLNTPDTSGLSIHSHGQLVIQNEVKNSQQQILGSAKCTTLSQEKPGGPMKKVPCNLAVQAARNSIANSFNPDDFEANLDLSQESMPYTLEGQGWSALTTGSIQKKSDRPPVAETKAEGWTAQLEEKLTPTQ